MQVVSDLTDSRCLILRKTGLFSELRTEETLFAGKLPIASAARTNNVSCVREIREPSYFVKIAAPLSVQTPLTEERLSERPLKRFQYNNKVTSARTRE